MNFRVGLVNFVEDFEDLCVYGDLPFDNDDEFDNEDGVLDLRWINLDPKTSRYEGM